MAKAFQHTLEQYGLTQKIHTVNADNPTTNDRQTTKLTTLDNSFEEANHVQCFNHTLQLSTKALLTSFNMAISQVAARSNKMPEDDDNQLVPHENVYDKFASDDDDDDDNESEEVVDEVDEGDGIDELDKMSGVEQNWVLENTAEVHETVTKVHQYTFALTLVIHYWLLTNLTDLMAGIHNHPFNNNCTPCMVPYLLKIQLQKEGYPPWCGNSMELNLQHDAICTQIPTCYWWYHC